MSTLHAPARRPALAALLWLGGLLVLLLTTGCASLPAPTDRPASHALPAAEGTLARIARANAAPDATQSGFRLLPDGEQALDARLALVRRAEHSIDAQYYLVHADDSGLRFLGALREAAARGVRVRLLIDDLYTDGEQPLLATLAALPNFELRLYNPLPVRRGGFAMRLALSLHEFERINQRMHNKLLVVDGVFAVAGGRNIGDEYFMRSHAANFVDLDVLASGPVVAAMAAVFDRYWNHPRSWPVQALGVAPLDAEALQALLAGAAPIAPAQGTDALGRASVESQFADGRLEQHFGHVQLFADAPDKAGHIASAFDDSAMRAVLMAMRQARREVLIASPYFIPGERGLAMLRDAADHGIRIRLLTNSIAATDEPLVYQGYAPYRLPMLKLGVTIDELSPQLVASSGRLGSFGSSSARLHAKVAVIDQRLLAIGSMNMDPRSAALNTEMGLVIDCPALASEVARLLQPEHHRGAYRLQLAADGEHIEWLAADGERERVTGQEPEAGWFTKLKLNLLSLWVGEALL